MQTTEQFDVLVEHNVPMGKFVQANALVWLVYNYARQNGAVKDIRVRMCYAFWYDFRRTFKLKIQTDSFVWHHNVIVELDKSLDNGYIICEGNYQ
jgi:hypothetical protein